MTEDNIPVDWLNLPRVPFDIIMTKIAHESLTTLRSCTEVCSAWNKMIEKDILKKPTMMNTIRDKMKRAFGPEVRVNPFAFLARNRMQLPSNEEISNAKWLSGKNLLNIEVVEKFAVRVREWLPSLDSLSLTTCAASLAYHGLLGQRITCLGLFSIDLTSVPTEHLAALASWVTSSCDVSIYNVRGIDMDSFLNSLKCQDFEIYRQILGQEETEALVQAMESRVERVQLQELVSLEMETLVTYSGLGRCWVVTVGCCDDDTELWRVNIKEPLKNWALSRDWTVTTDYNSLLTIRRR